MLCDQATKWNHHVYACLFKLPIFQHSTRTFHLFIHLPLSVSHIKLHIVYNWAKRTHSLQKKPALNFEQMTVRWPICHYNISIKAVPNLKEQTLKNKQHLKSWVFCSLKTFRENLAMVVHWHKKKSSGNEKKPTRGSKYHLSIADQTQQLNRRQNRTNWFENKKSWGSEIAVTNYES